MMKMIILAALLCSSSAFASSLTLGRYLKVQEALAADDFKTSLSTHQELCSKDAKAIGPAYKDCNKSFKNIDELRTSFKVLSEVYIKNIPLSDLKGVTKASCPMASARWIQKDGALRNPYYGKSMLECGEKI
jgi:hypothetical protein